MSTSPRITPLNIPKSPVKDENENYEEEGLLSPQDIRSSKFWGFYQGLQEPGDLRQSRDELSVPSRQNIFDSYISGPQSRRRFIARADAVDETEDGSTVPGTAGQQPGKPGGLTRTQSANYPAASHVTTPEHHGTVQGSPLNRAQTFHAPTTSLRSISHSPGRAANLKRGNTFHIPERSQSSSQAAARLANRSPSPQQTRHAAAAKKSSGKKQQPPSGPSHGQGHSDPSLRTHDSAKQPPGFPQPDYPATYPGRGSWEGDHMTQHGRRDLSPTGLDHGGPSSRQPKPYIKRANTYNSAEEYLDSSQPWKLQDHKSTSLSRINEGVPEKEQSLFKPASNSQSVLWETPNKPMPPVKDDNELGPSRAERIAQYKEQRRKELAQAYGGTSSSAFDSSQPDKKSKKGKKKESKEEKPSAISSLATAALPLSVAVPSSNQPLAPAGVFAPTPSSRAVIASMHERGIFSPPPLLSREIGVFSPPPRVTNHEYGVFSPPPSLMSPNACVSPASLTRSQTSPAPGSAIQKPQVVRSKTQPEGVPYPFALTPQQPSAPHVPSAAGHLTSGHSDKSPFAPPLPSDHSAAHSGRHKTPLVATETSVSTSVVTPFTTASVAVTSSIKSALSSSMTSVAQTHAEAEDLFRRTGSLDRSNRPRRMHYTPLTERIQEKREKIVENRIGQSSSLPRQSRSSRIGGDRKRLAEPPQLYTRSHTEPAIPENPAGSPPAFLPIQTVAPSMASTGTQTGGSLKSSTSNLPSQDTAEKGVQSPPPLRLDRSVRSPTSSDIRSVPSSDVRSPHSSDIHSDKTGDIRSPRQVRRGMKPDIRDSKPAKSKNTNKMEKQSESSVHTVQGAVDKHIQEAAVDKTLQSEPAVDKEREITPPFPLTLASEVATAPSTKGPVLEPQDVPEDQVIVRASSKSSQQKPSGPSKPKQENKDKKDVFSGIKAVLSPKSGKKVKKSIKSPPIIHKVIGNVSQSNKLPSKLSGSKSPGGSKKPHKLMREDSFNRPDSPVRDPLPLPKYSVIGRSRQPRDLSSSSEDTPPTSPIVSPRVSRRQKRQHVRTDGAGVHVPGSPGSPEKKHSKHGQPKVEPVAATEDQAVSNINTSGSQELNQVPPGEAGANQLTPVSPVEASSEKMGQESSKVPPRGLLSPAQQYFTPPGTPKSDKSDRTHGSVPVRTDLLSPVDTGQKISDSSTSTTSSKRERRRFLRRDDSTESSQPQPVASTEHPKVKPGKKDKSSTRKSSLNAPGALIAPSKDVNRAHRDETPSSDDVQENIEGRRRQRITQIQSGNAASKAAESKIRPPEKPKETPFPIPEEHVVQHRSPTTHQAPGSLPSVPGNWNQSAVRPSDTRGTGAHLKSTGTVMRQDKVVAKVLPQPQVISPVTSPPPEKPVTRVAPQPHTSGSLPGYGSKAYEHGHYQKPGMFADQTVGMAHHGPAPHQQQYAQPYPHGPGYPAKQKIPEHQQAVKKVPDRHHGMPQPQYDLPPWKQDPARDRAVVQPHPQQQVAPHSYPHHQAAPTSPLQQQQPVAAHMYPQHQASPTSPQQQQVVPPYYQQQHQPHSPSHVAPYPQHQMSPQFPVSSPPQSPEKHGYPNYPYTGQQPQSTPQRAAQQQPVPPLPQKQKHQQMMAEPPLPAKQHQTVAPYQPSSPVRPQQAPYSAHQGAMPTHQAPHQAYSQTPQAPSLPQKQKPYSEKARGQAAEHMDPEKVKGQAEEPHYMDPQKVMDALVESLEKEEKPTPQIDPAQSSQSQRQYDPGADQKSTQQKPKGQLQPEKHPTAPSASRQNIESQKPKEIPTERKYVTSSQKKPLPESQKASEPPRQMESVPSPHKQVQSRPVPPSQDAKESPRGAKPAIPQAQKEEKPAKDRKATSVEQVKPQRQPHQEPIPQRRDEIRAPVQAPTPQVTSPQDSVKERSQVTVDPNHTVKSGQEGPPPSPTVISPELQSALMSLSTIGSPTVPDLDSGPSPPPSTVSKDLPDTATSEKSDTLPNTTEPLPQKSILPITQDVKSVASTPQPAKPVLPTSSKVKSPPTSPVSPTSPTSPSDTKPQVVRKLSVENVILQPTPAVPAPVTATSPAQKVAKVDIIKLAEPHSKPKESAVTAGQGLPVTGAEKTKVTTTTIHPQGVPVVSQMNTSKQVNIPKTVNGTTKSGESDKKPKFSSEVVIKGKALTNNVERKQGLDKQKEQAPKVTSAKVQEVALTPSLNSNTRGNLTTTPLKQPHVLKAKDIPDQKLDTKQAKKDISTIKGEVNITSTAKLSEQKLDITPVERYNEKGKGTISQTKLAQQKVEISPPQKQMRETKVSSNTVSTPHKRHSIGEVDRLKGMFSGQSASNNIPEPSVQKTSRAFIPISGQSAPSKDNHYLTQTQKEVKPVTKKDSSEKEKLVARSVVPDVKPAPSSSQAMEKPAVLEISQPVAASAPTTETVRMREERPAVGTEDATVDKQPEPVRQKSPAKDLSPTLQASNTDISALVKRFSSSSGSEREKTPPVSPYQKETSTAKSETKRLTPERAQSFKDSTTSADKSKTNVVMRTQSVRDKGVVEKGGVVMRDKGAAEKGGVVMRDKGAAEKGGVVIRRKNRSDKPDDELQKILNRRSSHLEEWEAQLAANSVSQAERAVEEYEQIIEKQKQRKQKIVPKELVSSELYSALKTKKIRDSLEESEKNVSSSEEEFYEASTTAAVDLDTVIGKVVDSTKPGNVTFQEQEELPDKGPSSILRHDSDVYAQEPKVQSILKKRSSTDEPSLKSILKHDSVEADSSEIHPVSILKRDSMELEAQDIQPVSILKRDSMELDTSEIKPILRRDSKEHELNLKPILRRGSQEISSEKPVSILRDPGEGQKSVKLSSSVQIDDVPYIDSEDVVTGPSHQVKLQRSETLPDSPGKERDGRILRKAKTIDVAGMDPMFARLVQQRQVYEEDSSPEDGRKHRSPSPFEEGQEGKKRLSVAERITQMEMKLDDPTTPGTSGLNTPSRTITIRSVSVSGSATPQSKSQAVEEPCDATKAMSDEALLARLSDVALLDEAADRRRRFQKRRGDDWRVRTMPVTCEEVKEADGLDSVMMFRAEIIKNTSLNIFRQRQKMAQKPIRKIKGQEIAPQPFRREKLKERHRGARFKTQPITMEELSVIKESGEPLTPITLHIKQPSKKKSQRKRIEEMRLRLLEDSEDSDFDKLVEVNYRKLTEKESKVIEEFTRSLDVPEDDKSKMSLAQKMALFKKLEEGRAAAQVSSTSTAPQNQKAHRRYMDRKKRIERSKTQPVTEEELTKASDFAKNGAQGQTGEVPPEEAEGQGRFSDPDENQGSEDELSKLSLAEKMKIFSERKEEKVPPKRAMPVVRRKPRKLQSRFKTQPITVEEVEKAANWISPLAMSLVKPPDPELLASMTLKDQREFMARWAQETLTALPGMRPGRRGSQEEGPVTEILPTPTMDASGNLVYQESLSAENLSRLQSELNLDSQQGEHILPANTRTTKSDKIENREVRGILKDPRVGRESKNVETKDRANISLNTNSGAMDNIVKNTAAIDIAPSTPKTPEMWDPAFVERTSSVKKKEDADGDSDKRVKNEAIERRRRKTEERKAKERSSGAHPVDAATPAHTAKLYGSAGPHHTQPITDLEKRGALEKLETTTPKGSIADRSSEDSSDSDGLSKLHQSEETWKKRVSKLKDSDTPLSGDVVRLRDKSGTAPTERPRSIMDRLSKLQESQQGWKNKVEKDKDVEKLTVEGKMKSAGITPAQESPLVARRKKTRAPLTREAESSDQSAPNSPEKPVIDPNAWLTPLRSRPRSETDPIKYGRTVVQNGTKSAPLPIAGLSDSPESDPESGSKSPSKVAIPKTADEGFQTFFQTKTVEELSAERVEVSFDDFEHVFQESQNILSNVRKARPQRAQRTATKNPMKSLAARTDIQAEYTEVRTDVAEREMKRIKRDEIAGKASLAQEALAGLASKENFRKVALRKTESFGGFTPGSTGKHEPFKDVMLLHIKGRRHCQTRLVEPCPLSINSGDCFVLVTPEKVFVWIGEYANVIEKRKANAVATHIQQKRDLGCKSHHEPYIIEEVKQDRGHGRAFWNILGGLATYQECGPQEEDELYEMYTAETNRVYRLDPSAERLAEVTELRGTMLTQKMLNSKQVFVFDFGSEMYVWTGKSVAFANRKMALKLAKEIWDRGYDYSEFDINPMSPLLTVDKGGLPAKAAERPDWALFGKVNENMETVLFQGKFSDWPDSSQIIKVKMDTDAEPKGEPAPELTPADENKMLAINTSPVTLILEGSHVGRGDRWVETHEGLRRELEIQTLSIKMWHVMEYDRHEMEEISYGQFHQEDTYVVRWHYMIAQAGMRDLKGQVTSRHSFTGRERCAYFFWQGRLSSVTEKGASALMTVELDEERGPQVRVEQGKEFPCFVRLFKGHMVIHIGRREVEESNTMGTWRMYTVRNELPKEAYLLEIPCAMRCLRSRCSMLLVNSSSGQLLLWHGAKVGTHTKQRCTDIALGFKKHVPQELGINAGVKVKLTAMEEGKETPEFYEALGSDDHSLYHSLLNMSRPYQYTPRLFHMTSVAGVFEATEVMNPMRDPRSYQPFPFVQRDLYKAAQPGLFLVDNDHEVYLWQGWWPEETEEVENVKTGSAHARFNVDRRLALETTLAYCNAKTPKNPPPAYLIFAGSEPMEFTNIFPYWEHDLEVCEISEKDGHEAGEMILVDDLLQKLAKTRYTLEELQVVPLPEGVDPLKLETYLEDEEFMDVLKMSREEFYSLPAWKQGNLKKETGLF